MWKHCCKTDKYLNSDSDKYAHTRIRNIKSGNIADRPTDNAGN